MVGQRVFRQSRQGKLAALMMWVALVGVDLFVVATHLHSLNGMQWIIAALWFTNAAIWTPLLIHSLKAAQDE